MQYLKNTLVRLVCFLVLFVIVLSGYRFFGNIDRDAEEFLYLAGIVKEATGNKVTETEKVEALTEWLSENVKKTTDYPDWEQGGYPAWFDDSSEAAVIKGGIGNCGIVATCLTTLTQYLGIPTGNMRRLFVGGPRTEFEHVFAEIVVDGKPGVFDPNLLLYETDDHGVVLSLSEMIDDPARVSDETFRAIVIELSRKDKILMGTQILKAQMPLGENSYKMFESYGKTITELFLYFQKYSLAVLLQTCFIFVVVLMGCSRVKRSL